MRILITNDDGVHAMGIIALAKRLSLEHEVVVAAPDHERSACSHSITLDRPLGVKRVYLSDYQGIEAYSVNGTPADCVKMGICVLMKKIDLVIAGINFGANLGMDTIYSGTVNAALEASMYGYPALALSQKVSRSMSAPEYVPYFKTAAECSAQIVAQMDVGAMRGYTCNINYPLVAAEQLKGIKVCTMGRRYYDIAAEKQEDLFGREFYWLVGREDDTGYNEQNKTDLYWGEQNYITATPFHWDMTCKEQLEHEKCKIEGIKLHF